MAYKDKQKQIDYQRLWIAKRRQFYFEGKVCVHCGTNENLELDHIDSSTKTSHNIWSWSEDRRNAELAKCQVLCRLCHQGKSFVMDRYHAPHGSSSMYSKHGCRCDICREGKAKADKKFRSKLQKVS
jgi:hypothetical protein